MYTVGVREVIDPADLQEDAARSIELTMTLLRPDCHVADPKSPLDS